MASNTDVVKKLYYNMSVLCLYVCVCMSVSAVIKTRSSNFPELLMMMPMARSTASQVGGDAENARPENDGQTCGHSRFSG